LRRALEDSGFELVLDATEAMDLTFSTEALEDVIVETLKRRGRRPDGDGGEVVEDAGDGDGEARGPHPDQRVRLARRAMRGVAHVAARAMVGTIARGGALLGRGDSLITLARLRR
jgi:hypothetical protein